MLNEQQTHNEFLGGGDDQPPLRHKSLVVDAFLHLLTLLEQFCGIKYPGRPIQLSIDYYLPTLRSLKGEELRTGLKMIAVKWLFKPTPHPNKHQYAILITSICDEDAPDLSEMVIRVAKIHYGILNLENPDISLLEAFLKKKFQAS